MVGIWFKKNFLFWGSATATRHPTILQIDLKTPQNVSLLDSDNPTTFPQRTGLTFFSWRSDLDERRDFMLSAEKQPHPSAPVRQAPGRKSAVVRSMIPLHFRHFPLVFSLGAWYNKDVIPQPLHQLQRERAASMSNTKMKRNIFFAVVAFFLTEIAAYGAELPDKTDKLAEETKTEAPEDADRKKAEELYLRGRNTTRMTNRKRPWSVFVRPPNWGMTKRRCFTPTRA